MFKYVYIGWVAFQVSVVLIVGIYSIMTFYPKDGFIWRLLEGFTLGTLIYKLFERDFYKIINYFHMEKQISNLDKVYKNFISCLPPFAREMHKNHNKENRSVN